MAKTGVRAMDTVENFLTSDTAPEEVGICRKKGKTVQISDNFKTKPNIRFQKREREKKGKKNMKVSLKYTINKKSFL